MEYRIKNENMPLYITTTVLAFMSFFFLVLISITHSPVLFYCMLAMFALTGVCLILCVLFLILRTKIIVTEDTVTIKHVLLRKKILVKDITSVFIDTIQRYRRKPEIHYEYKMKMTISVLSGRNIVLYDDASRIDGFAGFVTGEREQRPNEEVPLYQAYEQIQGLLKK